MRRMAPSNSEFPEFWEGVSGAEPLGGWSWSRYEPAVCTSLPSLKFSDLTLVA